jgi:hypothetical protein
MTETSHVFGPGEMALVAVANDLLNIVNSLCPPEVMHELERRHDDLIEASFAFHNEMHGASDESSRGAEKQLQQRYGVERWQSLIADASEALAGSVRP